MSPTLKSRGTSYVLVPIPLLPQNVFDWLITLKNCSSAPTDHPSTSSPHYPIPIHPPRHIPPFFPPYVLPHMLIFHNNIIFHIRIILILSILKGCADFVPICKEVGSQFANACFETFDEVAVKARTWISEQRCIRVTNVQSIDYKLLHATCSFKPASFINAYIYHRVLVSYRGYKL